VFEFIKDQNYKNKIIPMMVNTAKIFSAENRLNYITYWNKRYNDLDVKIKSLNDLIAVNSLIEDLKHLKKINEEIGDFLTYLSDRKTDIIIENSLNINYDSFFKTTGYNQDMLSNDLRRIIDIVDDEERELELEDILSSHPHNKELKFYMAVNAKRTNKPKKAKKYYEEVINSNIVNSTVYNNYANLLLISFNETSNAKENYLKALEKNNSNFAAHNDYASYLIEYEKDITGAVEHFTESLLLNPINAEGHIGLANILAIYLNDKELAKDHYSIALSINPNLKAIIYNNYALNIVKDGKSSIKFLKKAIEFDNNYFEAYVNLGHEYGKLKNLDEAIIQYKSALKIKENAQVYVTLGLTLLANDEDGNEYIEKALKLEPQILKDLNISI